MAVNLLLAFLARYRLHLSFFVFAALVLEWQLVDGGRPHSLLTLRDAVHPVGGSLIALGLLLRSWAAGVIRKQAALTTAGPYALLRHPLYMGSFLMTLGFAAVMEDPLAIAVVLIAVPLIYAPVIRNEEQRLAAKFGVAWDEYARRTPAILPRFHVPFSCAGWSWERWRCNREWRILLRTFALLGLLEWWNA